MSALLAGLPTVNWITIVWPMVAAACLTLGFINLGIGLAQRPRAARLLFFVCALSAAVFSGIELAFIRVTSIADTEPLLRWGNVSAASLVVTLTAFIWVFFGTGNKWLAGAVVAVYAFALTFDFFPGSHLTYKQVTGIRTIKTFGGASYNIIEGVPNPWNALTYVAALLLVLFVVDASVKLWRRGEHRRAVVVGGGVTLTVLASAIHSALVETGLLHMPYVISWAYLAIMVAMGIELNVDVSAAAKLSWQLRESESRIELASAAANVGMWTWDIGRDSIWATKRARALFGLSEGEPLDFARFLSLVHPDDRDAVRRAIEASLSSDKDFEVEYRVQLRDGEIRWIGARGRVERNPDKKPILMRGAVLDTTGRHRSESDMRQLQNQLAHVGRVSTMGQLASALAHELNQPLGAILRNAEAAELFLEHQPPDLDEVRAILTDIRKDDQRAGEVIARLRALLKRRSIEPRAVEVSEVLSNVAALARPDAAARHIALEFTAAPDLPTVRGDRVHLQQVLLNLVLNAMDAVDGVPSGERRVTIHAYREGSLNVEIAVRDTGSGIPQELVSSVFEAFFTTKPNGMGMGLPISRTIIEAHGGRLWAENNEERGATFRFTLPATGHEATSAS